MQNNTKKRILNSIKFFLASTSVTSLIGLWTLFSKEENYVQINIDNDLPDPQEENLFNDPLPTLVPSILESESSEPASQDISQVAPPPEQPKPDVVVEKIVVGSSGGSGGSSSTRTSSSR